MSFGEGHTDAADGVRSQRFLIDAGKRLASSLDFEKTLSEVAHLAVRSRADCRVRCSWTVLLRLAMAVILAPALAWAGPPFFTDDPAPVPLHHWELYLASQWEFGGGSATGSLPHVEANYGVLPNVQLHLLIPAVLAHGPGETHYGLGDLELGAKWRFLSETARRPQVGIFPLLELPTGSAARGLGEGTLQLFVPVWIQKSFGDWVTYGGGGVRFTGTADVDLEAGWLVQRQITKPFALGAEAYVTVPMDGRAVQLQLNVGAVVDLSEKLHLLGSVGPSFGGGTGGQGYFAFLATL